MYVKLFASLYQGTLRGCSDEILVFTNLLAHADVHGIVDKHWRAISEETGLSRERVEAAITHLEAPDPESRSPEQEGRRIVKMDEHRAWGWKIVNYGKYRSIRNEDDRREQNRIAQERWRNKNKQSKPRKPESAQAEAEAEAEEKKSKSTPLNAALLVSSTSGLSLDTAQEYLDHRKSKRSPLKERAWKAILAEIQKTNLTADEALATAMQRGWTGFEAAWITNQSRGNGNGRSEHLANVAAELTGRNRGSQRTIDGESISID